MILERFGIEGKVALITGGGTNLGKAMSHALARAGADIAVAGRTPETIEETAAEVRTIGRRSAAVPADVTDSAQVDRLMSRVLKEFGRLDILINNAGVARGIEPSPRDPVPKEPGPIWEWTDEMWRRGIDANLTSVFYCCRAVSKHMIARKSGKVINISSAAGLRAARSLFTYCSAKAGVIMLTKTLALTWARENIQVNCIAPGIFRTPETDPGVVSLAAGTIPMGRCGEAEEIGPLAVFLASDASNYITGECFVIDGARFVGYAPAQYAPVIHLED
jgi:NAD(P)-dependent dehydrogenase (short-subunit alcohol dehydrogenase family)